MQIDKKYVELISKNLPITVPSIYKYLAWGGFVLIIVGFYVYVGRGIFGLMLSVIGVIATGIGALLNSKNVNKKRADFMAYYEKNGYLPPWSELEIKNKENTDSK